MKEERLEKEKKEKWTLRKKLVLAIYKQKALIVEKQKNVAAEIERKAPVGLWLAGGKNGKEESRGGKEPGHNTKTLPAACVVMASRQCR